jgi:hypothetical protein
MTLALRGYSLRLFAPEFPQRLLKPFLRFIAVKLAGGLAESRDNEAQALSRKLGVSMLPYAGGRDDPCCRANLAPSRDTWAARENAFRAYEISNLSLPLDIVSFKLATILAVCFRLILGSSRSIASQIWS